ncbi:MAG: hypothetical protein IH820_06665 [Bacteroidetes bacterium]|nr:hypothetical protein [Bacteroidota bacterium]
MNKTPLRRLFAYDRWANNRVLGALDVLAPLNASDPLAKLISHIIAAQLSSSSHVKRLRSDERRAPSRNTRTLGPSRTASSRAWSSGSSVTSQARRGRHRTTLRPSARRRIRGRPRFVVPDDVPDER